MLSVLATPLYIILGIVVIGGTLVGAILLLAKWIFDANEHNINTCDCANCRHRRAQLVAQRIQEEEEAKPPVNPKRVSPKWGAGHKSRIISTTDLRQGMWVLVNDRVWLVTGIVAVRSGVSVNLYDSIDKKFSFNIVKREMFDTPMWTVRPTDWRMPERPK